MKPACPATVLSEVPVGLRHQVRLFDPWRKLVHGSLEVFHGVQAHDGVKEAVEANDVGAGLDHSPGTLDGGDFDPVAFGSDAHVGCHGFPGLNQLA